MRYLVSQQSLASSGARGELSGRKDHIRSQRVRQGADGPGRRSGTLVRVYPHSIQPHARASLEAPLSRRIQRLTSAEPSLHLPHVGSDRSSAGRAVLLTLELATRPARSSRGARPPSRAITAAVGKPFSGLIRLTFGAVARLGDLQARVGAAGSTSRQAENPHRSAQCRIGLLVSGVLLGNAVLRPTIRSRFPGKHHPHPGAPHRGPTRNS